MLFLKRSFQLLHNNNLGFNTLPVTPRHLDTLEEFSRTFISRRLFQSLTLSDNVMKTISLLAYTISVSAYFDEFFFADNGTCPELSDIDCKPPDQVCAHDFILERYYCCGGEQSNVCWTEPVDCDGENGGPSSSQQKCTDVGYNWCCLASEACTQQTGVLLLLAWLILASRYGVLRS